MPGLSWPDRCTFEWVAPHPKQARVAVGCTHFRDNGSPSDDEGAVVVIDAAAGKLRSITRFNSWVSGFDDMLRWDESGRRIAANIDTNTIALIEAGKVVLEKSPDDGRDHGFDFVWVGSRLFIDLGGFLGRAQEPPHLAPPDALLFGTLHWNAATKAVVGVDGTHLRSVDPVAQRTRFDVDIKKQEKLPGGASRSMPAGRIRCSPDGRRCAARRSERHLRRGAWSIDADVFLYSGDDGKQLAIVKPSLHDIDDLVFGPSGQLAFRSYVYRMRSGVLKEHIDIVTGDKRTASIDLGKRRVPRGGGPSELDKLAWSADGRRLAILLEGGDVQVHDSASGKLLATFAAPSPPVPGWIAKRKMSRRYSQKPGLGGLAWSGSERIIRGNNHFLTVWTADGQKLAEWVAEQR